MPLSNDTRNRLDGALTSKAAGAEIAALLASADTDDGTGMAGSPGAVITAVAVTFTAGTPATYASPTGALTIADGATPTVVELEKYCNELRKNIVDIAAALHARGITA